MCRRLIQEGEVHPVIQELLMPESQEWHNMCTEEQKRPIREFQKFSLEEDLNNKV